MYLYIRMHRHVCIQPSTSIHLYSYMYTPTHIPIYSCKFVSDLLIQTCACSIHVCMQQVRAHAAYLCVCVTCFNSICDMNSNKNTSFSKAVSSYHTQFPPFS